MHFFVAQLFSIAVITETYVRHVRNLRPMNRLIYCAHSEWTSTAPRLSARVNCVNARHRCRLIRSPGTDVRGKNSRFTFARETPRETTPNAREINCTCEHKDLSTFVRRVSRANVNFTFFPSHVRSRSVVWRFLSRETPEYPYKPYTARN